jgi:hypothetical protein
MEVFMSLSLKLKQSRLYRLAKQWAEIYLTHQSWKAHDGVFMPITSGPEQETAGAPARSPDGQWRSLRKLAGVKLSAFEAESVWPRILEHKWVLGERLGRDVGLRVAAVDYFENIEPPRTPVSIGTVRDGLPPRLPMMLSFGERP